MKICVINASMRTKSQSRKVSDYLITRINHLGHNAHLIDLYELKLPAYDDSDFDGKLPDSVSHLLTSIEESDGYIFVSPEWDGMMSYGLINMLHYVKNQMAHKPVMLVGVSSSRGGARPLAQMKMIGQKNKHYIISPENLIVGYVNEMLNDTNFDNNSKDYALKQRADYALKVLILYAEKLVSIRHSEIIDFERFGSGV